MVKKSTRPYIVFSEDEYHVDKAKNWCIGFVSGIIVCLLLSVLVAIILRSM